MSKRINFEDDVVMVTDLNANVVRYKGLEDYEPMKDENWVWKEKEQAYFLTEEYEGTVYNYKKEKVA